MTLMTDSCLDMAAAVIYPGPALLAICHRLAARSASHSQKQEPFRKGFSGLLNRLPSSKNIYPIFGICRSTYAGATKQERFSFLAKS
jgi:hypothetical protein